MKPGKVLLRVFLILIATAFLLFIAVIFAVWMMYKTKNKGNLVSVPKQQEIPFTFTRSGHILVPLQFDNDSTVYPFILDSGGSNYFFDKFLKEKQFHVCGISISRDSGGNIAFPVIRKTTTVKMGNVQFSGLRFESGPFPNACYDNVYGILGKEAMRFLAWQIDFTHQQIIVSGNIENLPVPPNTPEKNLGENKFSHHLYITLKMQDTISKTFLFDTGNSGALSVRQGYLPFDRGASDSVRCIGVSSKGVNGKSQSEAMLVHYSDLSINDSLHLQNVWADRSATGLNLFGLGIMERFKVTFDWNKKIVYLEPEKELSGFTDSSLGFMMDYENGETKISAVIENSLAYDAGIRSGQKVLSVNGVKFSSEDDYCNFSLSEIDSVRLSVLGADSCTLNVTCKRELLSGLSTKE